MADDDILTSIQNGPPTGAVAGAAVATSYLGLPSGLNPTPRFSGPGFSGFGFNFSNPSDPKTIYGERGGYTEADILLPAGLSPEKIATMQRELARAGLYGGKGAVYRKGLWDDATQAAYQRALMYANQNGIDVNGALSELIANPLPDDPNDKPPVEPGRIDKVTDDLTLEQQVQQAAQNRLGRKLRKNEIAKFVTLYQGLERKDNARYGAAVEKAQGGEDVTFESQVATPDVQADEFIDTNNGQEAAAQDAYSYFDALKSLLGG